MSINKDELEHDAALQAALEAFRISALAAADRPAAFWDAQRKAVLSKVKHMRRAIPWRPAVWAAAAAVVMVVTVVWLDGPRAAPAPDFAAGYDQELLIDVERLTGSELPSVLEPAMALAGEIEAGNRELPATRAKRPPSAFRTKQNR